MTTSIVDAESVLAVDIGTVNTRAMLFDMVDGQYRLVASGVVSSTADAPFRDVGECFHQALRRVQEITGRALYDAEARLIFPAQPNNSGIDRLVVTYSCGPELKLVAVGLLEEVSLESALNLANTSYARVVDKIGLNDHRKQEAQIDALLKADPDIILVAGGTEGGASRSVYKVADLVALACRLMPAEKKPEIIFAGNQSLGQKIQEVLSRWTSVQLTPNIRPTIDDEDLTLGQNVLAQTVTKIRNHQLGGLENLGMISSSPPMPTARAFGRMVRIYSRWHSGKTVLGVDVGSQSTVIAGALNGNMWLNTHPFGMGKGAGAVLEKSKLQDLMQWLPMHLSESDLRDYLYQKTVYPATIPMTQETYWIEQALARQAIRMSLNATMAHSEAGANQWYEPILATGAVLTNTAHQVHSLLAVLDGVQPVGITTVLLDTNGLLPALGAIAPLNSILPVQVLDSAMLSLGTVICPVSEEKYGTPILQVRLDYGDNNKQTIEVQQGTVVQLPLQYGQPATINVKPLRRTFVDPRNRRGITDFKIYGGVCGAVIDARGRPLNLPVDDSRRRDMIKKWILTLGG